MNNKISGQSLSPDISFGQFRLLNVLYRVIQTKLLQEPVFAHCVRVDTGQWLDILLRLSIWLPDRPSLPLPPLLGGGMKERILSIFRTRNQNGRLSTCFKWKGSRITLMQLWSVKIEGAHVNHQWDFQRVDAAWGFGFESSGHTWTINWGTISMWPWSREIRRLTRL